MRKAAHAIRASLLASATTIALRWTPRSIIPVNQRPNGVSLRSLGLPASRDTPGTQAASGDPTPTGLRLSAAATPLGLKANRRVNSQGLQLRSRPWATRRDPVGVKYSVTRNLSKTWDAHIHERVASFKLTPSCSAAMLQRASMVFRGRSHILGTGNHAADVHRLPEIRFTMR